MLARLLVILAVLAGPSACSPKAEGGPGGAPGVPASADDLCGASDLQWLVGRSRVQAPVTTEMSTRRVTCTTCPAAQDYNPGRVNVLYDLKTGIVKEVRCG